MSYLNVILKYSGYLIASFYLEIAYNIIIMDAACMTIFEIFMVVLDGANRLHFSIC